MKKKAILLIIVILLSTTGLVQAQERNLSGTFDITYLNKYILGGFDVYEDDESAIQPSIDLDLYGTGLGLNVLWSRANTSGFENTEWFVHTLYYKKSAFESETYATNYKLSWTYFNYPDNSSRVSDFQTTSATLLWPKVCPTGIVPSYTVICLWPARSNSSMGEASGWLHGFRLDYDWTVPGLLPDTSEQTIHLSAEVWYNNGASVHSTPGVSVDHDWSHMVFGISTDFEIHSNLTFTPAIYYQSSWEDTVNEEDEFWVGLSMKYKF